MMKILIAEDDTAGRLVIEKFLSRHGIVHLVGNGKAAVERFAQAYEAKEPFDLVCLDVMMPDMDGQLALKEIRAFEESHPQRSGKRTIIFMTTALNDKANVLMASSLCDAYLVKPISYKALRDKLSKFKLVT